MSTLTSFLAALCLMALAFCPYFPLRGWGLTKIESIAVAPTAGISVAGSLGVIFGACKIPYFPAGIITYLLFFGAVFLWVWLHRANTKPTLLPKAGNLRSISFIFASLILVTLPVVLAFKNPAQILQRWDYLYHLNALRFIADTGDASTLHLGALSTADGEQRYYPAGLHALLSLIPVNILPNGAAAVILNLALLLLCSIPFAFGMAAITARIWPDGEKLVRLSGVLATFLPAAPLSLLLYVAYVPNAVGFALMPGCFALLIRLFQHLRSTLVTWREQIVDVLVTGGIGLGLALVHPAAFIAATTTAAVACFSHLWFFRKRSRYGLFIYLTPLLLLLPYLGAYFSPLAQTTSSFSRGANVSVPLGLGELLSGLYPVWPMPLSVLLMIAALPTLARGFQTWIFAPKHPGSAVIFSVFFLWSVLYIDAVINSPLHLSGLWYGGRDRIAIPLAVTVLIAAIASLGWWKDKLPKVGQMVALTLVVVSLLVSLPMRYQNTVINTDPDYPGRPRFLNSDELTAFAQHAPALSRAQQTNQLMLLASPYSGAAHLYGLYGVKVRFPVAGIDLYSLDRQLLDAVPRAGIDPAACALLQQHHIGYIYADQHDYDVRPNFEHLWPLPDDLGPVIMQTRHSKLIKLECRADKK